MRKELRSEDELRAGKAYKKGKRDWISTPFAQEIKKCGSGKSWEGALKRTKKRKEIGLVCLLCRKLRSAEVSRAGNAY